MPGYGVASNQSSNLPQSTVIHYDKNFVKNLKARTQHVRCTNRRQLPLQSGNQHRLFMYNALGANIVQQAEGTVGSGIQVTVVNNTATIGQLADYANISDYALETAIDPVLENIQKELAYRLGQSLSTLTKNTADGASAIDASVNIAVPNASNFTRTNITNGVQSMRGRNIMPFDVARNRFCGVIHPFVVGDALNDTANNSLVDVLKRTVEGQMKLSELPAPDGDEVQVLEWGGVTFYESTLVTQTANYQSSGKTAFRTYIFGEDGVISISLGAKEGSQIDDGDWRNLKIYIRKAEEPTNSDPSKVIGGWSSYNVKYVATLPPDTTQRVRTIDSVSAVS